MTGSRQLRETIGEGAAAEAVGDPPPAGVALDGWAASWQAANSAIHATESTARPTASSTPTCLLRLLGVIPNLRAYRVGTGQREQLWRPCLDCPNSEIWWA